MSSDSNGHRKISVMVIGAAGQIGKALSFLLAKSGFVTKLLLNDIVSTNGLAEELNHIDVECCVESVGKLEDLKESEVDMVLMPCGKPQTSPDQKRDDLFKINANIFKVIMETLSLRLKNDPIYIVVGNPVNSLTVVCAETLKKTGRYHANKLFGLNELDVMRARRFVFDLTRVNPNEIDVPIIGGHSEKTIFPVLNSVKNLKTGKKIDLTDDQKISLYHDIRNAGDKVLQAYDSKGTSVYSTAFSVFRMVEKMTKCDNSIPNYAYVEHGLVSIKGLPRYFSCPIKFDKNGWSEINGLENLLDSMSDREKDELFGNVSENISTAENFLSRI